MSDHHSCLLAVPALELLGASLPDDADPDAHAELVRNEREAHWRYKPTGEGRITTWWRVPLLTGGATEIHAEIPDTTFLEIRWAARVRDGAKPTIGLSRALLADLQTPSNDPLTVNDLGVLALLLLLIQENQGQPITLHRLNFATFWRIDNGEVRLRKSLEKLVRLEWLTAPNGGVTEDGIDSTIGLGPRSEGAPLIEPYAGAGVP